MHGIKRSFGRFEEFIRSEESSGILLIVCTILSLLIANSAFGDVYTSILHWEFGPGFLNLRISISHWVNDALMAIFFLLVGLEIRREINEGELSSIKKALLPIIAAVGGILIPAGIYLMINFGGEPSGRGWGIPTATDIAFAVGIMSLLGNRVPLGLKVMLTALAIVDDLGAILMIAFFYTKDISLLHLGLAVGFFLILIILNRIGFVVTWIYLVLGLCLWYFIFQSGVHATVSGVLLAMVLPFGKGSIDSVAERVEHAIEKPVAYIIIPLFALCNTGFVLGASLSEIIKSDIGLGVLLGLFLGKPIGITLFSWITVKTGLAQLPRLTNWKQVIGAGFLGGIGFTMSIFITLLAFDDSTHHLYAKVAILIGSIASGIAGYMILRFNSR